MYANPLLKALFSESKPVNGRLANVRALLNSSSAVLVIVPCLSASLEIDPQLLEQPYYLLSHIIQLPTTTRDYRKGIEVTTLASSVVHLSESHVTPRRGFPAQTPVSVLRAYTWTPAVKYLSPERLLTVIEIDGLLIVPEQPRSLFNRPYLTQNQQIGQQQPIKKDLEQIIGRKKGPRAKASAILGPLLLGFKVTEYKDSESMGQAFRKMVQSANAQFAEILDTDIDTEDAVQEYFEYQTQSAILDQLKAIHSAKYGNLVLAKMHQNLQDVDISQLGLPNSASGHQYHDLVLDTAERLSSLETFHTTQDLVIIIMSCLESLASHGQSADILIGLLLLTIIKCPYKFTDVKIDLMRSFCKESLNVESGRLGYAVLTLESVFTYLRQEYPQLAALSAANRNFWQAIEKLDYDAIQECGTSEPLCLKSGPDGYDCLFYAIRQKDAELFRFFLTKFPHVFTPEYIFDARDKSSMTLLMCAMESFNRSASDIILELIIENFETDAQRQYFQHVDTSGKSIAHLMQYNDTLIAKIGHLVDWTHRDNSGTTPLLILAGCYDHADYDGMLSLAVSKWQQQRKNSASLFDHIDRKGNTLLHVVNPSSQTIIHKLSKTFGWDVDITNGKGRTAVMVAAKYDRTAMVNQLLEEGAQHWKVDGEGMCVFDHAKGKSLKATYKVAVDRSSLTVDARALKASAVNSHSMITIFHSNGRTIHRSYDDFMALCTALETNYPFSWVPQVRLDFDAVVDPWRAFKCRLRSTAHNADYFISLLQYHETFRNCEEFQEFCYADGSFEPEKHSDQKNHWQKGQNLDGTTKLSYSDFEADQIVTFCEYSIEQLKSFRLFYTRMASDSARVRIASHDHLQLRAYIFRLAYGLEDLESSDLLNNWLFNAQQPNLYEDPASSIMLCEARTTASLIEALSKPIELIKELRGAQSDLKDHREKLYQLGESKSWPIMYFEEKRTQAIQEEESAIFEIRNKIKELNNSISGTHYSLASELGSYNKFRNAITKDLVKTMASRELRMNKQVLNALLVTQKKHQLMCQGDA